MYLRFTRCVAAVGHLNSRLPRAFCPLEVHFQLNNSFVTYIRGRRRSYESRRYFVFH